ncbi:MAG TPA: response regulator, partial [Moraxellaceae bacterium]|nr:response regulator [Moraxellaceae bacterium]
MTQQNSISVNDQPTPPATGRPSDSLRVLVVDDSESIRRMLKHKIESLSLGSLNVEVETAANGEEAVERCEHGDYDVVFLDVVMPGMGGLEACRRIKSVLKARVAMLSSLKTPADHAAARAMGCDNYLSKPPQDFDIQAVLRIVSLRKMTALP